MNDFQNIGINEFALHQTKEDFVGTKLSLEQLERIRSICSYAFGLGTHELEDSPEFAFCKYVRISHTAPRNILAVPYFEYPLLEEIKAPTAEITEENKHLLVTQYRTRREGELPYLTRKFPKGSLEASPTNHLLVILYSKEQLEKEARINDDAAPPVGEKYDIICVNAEASELDAPMTPDTIVRNHLGVEFGGNGERLDKDKFMESVEYWDRYAMVDY